MRLPLQLEYRSPQGAFIPPAGARGRERIVVTTATANALSFRFRYFGVANRSALPTQRIKLAEQRRRVPANGAGHSIVPRFDAAAADRAWLRIDQRQRSVIAAIRN